MAGPEMNRNDTLTTREYWEEYYRNADVTAGQILSIGRNLEPFWQIWFQAAAFAPKTVLEIGAYPGRYLAYVASQYRLHPTALDFNTDQEKIRQAFSTMQVTDFQIVQNDFLEQEPIGQFDLVYSIGFIEHFDNFESVMDRHLQWLRPGGSLLLTVPNKRYFRKWYGLWLDRENLRAHNLKCMDLNIFRKFARRNRLLPVRLEYFGGFPYKVHQDLSGSKQFLYRAIRRIAKTVNPFLSKYPSALYSGTIIAIFTKPVSD